MSGQDPTELVVAGNGSLHVGPVGSEFPEGLEAPSTHFLDVGLTTEDGATFSRTPTIQEFKAWQSRSAVRREITDEEQSLSTSLEQWNAENFTLAFGGGEITQLGNGLFEYVPLGDSDALAENAAILDFNDGDKRYRILIPRCSVTEATEIQLQRGALANLPVNLKVLAPGAGEKPWRMITNDPAFGDAIAS